mgnify:CR=1 FL=1
MVSDVRSILALEVPVIVVLGERQLKLSDVVSLMPGTIIELPKAAEEELTLLVNNKPVGMGTAVKVGENFGIQLTYLGDVKARIAAMGGKEAGPSVDDQAAALADALLAEPATGGS